MATSFDTMKTYQSIAAAGIDEQAATAITAALADVAAAVRADVATKSDLENLRIATKSDLENLRLQLTGDTNTRFAEMRNEISKIGTTIEAAQKATMVWVIGTGLVVILAGVTFASHYLVLTTG